MRGGLRASGLRAFAALRTLIAGAGHPGSRKPEAVLLAALISISAVAQTSDSVQITLIEVPVTVVDRNGEPVRGLTAANFELYDEGKRRTITHFDVVDKATRMRFAATPDVQVEALPEQRPFMRNFMLLFDVSDSSPAALKRARDAALEFVDKQVQPLDRVAVGRVNVMKGFELLANFTLDRELVRAVIGTIGDPRQFHPKDPLLLAVADYEFMARAAKTPPGVEGKGRGGMAGGQFEDLARELDKNAREEQRHTAIRRFDNFAALGQVLDRIAGRKQVILLSEGFDAKAVQGREHINSEEAQKERVFIEKGQVWNVDSEARYGSSDALNAQKRMIDTLRRSDVVLHALDIKGLRNALNEEGERTTSTESLSLLTRDTGGSVYQSSNDLSTSFARILAHQDVTYILGFETNSSVAGKFHNLRVKVVNAPAGTRVTHRMGYYEESRATLDLDRTLAAGEILMNSIPVEHVRVRGYAAAFPHAGGVAQAPVVLEIDGPSLLIEAEGGNVPAELFVYAFDRDNVVRDFVYQRVSFDLGKLRAKLEGKGVKYYHTLMLPPGHYSVRALVRTSGGRSGFTAVPLHVPAAKEASVMPALLDDVGGWVMVKGADRASAPAYPFTIGETTFVPAARPSLKATTPYELALMTYHLPVENLQLSARIEGSTGVHPAPLALVGRTSPDDAGGVKLMLRLTPPQLPPGPYRLYVTMQPSNNAAQRTVWVPFDVE